MTEQETIETQVHALLHANDRNPAAAMVNAIADYVKSGSWTDFLSMQVCMQLAGIIDHNASVERVNTLLA